jgi:hypothetical protein
MLRTQNIHVQGIYFNCAYSNPTSPNLGDRREAKIHHAHLGAMLERGKDHYGENHCGAQGIEREACC